jgi:hypothetical protein
MVDIPDGYESLLERPVYGHLATVSDVRTRVEYSHLIKEEAERSLQLDPNYAWAQQVPKDDSRIKTEYATVSSPQGNGSIRDYLVRPAKASGKLPGVLVVHEKTP